MNFTRLLQYLHEIYPNDAISINISMNVNKDSERVGFVYWFHFNNTVRFEFSWAEMSAYITENYLRQSRINPDIETLFKSMMGVNK